MTGCNWNDCDQPGRHYLVGVRCPDHTPAAIAGRPEPLEPQERAS